MSQACSTALQAGDGAPEMPPGTAAGGARRQACGTAVQAGSAPEMPPGDRSGVTAAARTPDPLLGNPSPAAACDAFWRGRLRVWQPARGHGYRFNLDSVLLASFVPPGDAVLDLGAGCGIVGLLLCAADRARTAVAVEQQASLAALAGRNVCANGLEGRLRVICGDLRRLRLPRVDRVVFNPPYFAVGRGRGCGQPGRDRARHEHGGTLGDFVACAAAHLTRDGVVAAIVRAERGAELRAALAAAGLMHHRCHAVRPRPGLPPRHLLVQASALPLAATPAPTWTVHGPEGRTFSDHVARWVDGAGLMSSPGGAMP